MRENRRVNVIIVVSLLMISAAFALCATLVMSWVSASNAPAFGAQAFPASPEAVAELNDARREFRDRLLDPR